MSKARKAKWNIEENTREGYTRYSIRKYSMGVASVAVLSGFFFLTGISAQAAEITAHKFLRKLMQTFYLHPNRHSVKKQ